MSLAKKYDIEEDKIKRLIKDGWISCAVPKHEQAYNTYKSGLARGLPKPQAIANAAEETKLGERMVYKIIHRFELSSSTK